MKIYTKTGDAGETGLVGGQRVPKDSLRIEAIGDVDELNAVIGLCRLHACGSSLDTLLEQVQNRLFDLGAELASPDREQHQSLSEEDALVLEQSIDEQTARLEPLRNFILPGGCSLGCHLHIARAVCRRAERTVLQLHRSEPLRANVRVYLNRLSDWLFVAGRTANQEAGVQDVKWKRTEG